MQPVARHQLAMRAFGLRDLVLVVRKGQVDAAAVDVDGAAQVLGGHGRAFDVPAGPAPAPGRVPDRVFRLARLGEFPEREIGRRALVRARLNPGALFIVFRFAAGQLAIVRHGGHREPDAFLADIGVVLAHEAGDDLDHFRHMLRGPGLHARRKDVQRQHVGVVDVGKLLRDVRNRLAGVHRRLDQLVFDVGDVAREDDGAFAIGFHQQPAQHVKHDRRAGVADMGKVVGRRTADIDSDPLGILRLESALFARHGVVEFQGHPGLVSVCRFVGIVRAQFRPALMARCRVSDNRSSSTKR